MEGFAEAHKEAKKAFWILVILVLAIFCSTGITVLIWSVA